MQLGRRLRASEGKPVLSGERAQQTAVGSGQAAVGRQTGWAGRMGRGEAALLTSRETVDRQPGLVERRGKERRMRGEKEGS